MTQLKTQIEDLERFIDFLQGDASSPGPYLKKKNGGSTDSKDSAFPFFQQARSSKSAKSADFEKVTT